MTTFTWSILAMNTLQSVDGSPDIVVSANWQLTGVQDIHSANITAWAQFNLPQGDYTPFNQLTEEQVIGWVKNGYGEHGVEAFERNVQDRLDALLAPTIIPEPAALPW